VFQEQTSNGDSQFSVLFGAMPKVVLNFWRQGTDANFILVTVYPSLMSLSGFIASKASSIAAALLVACYGLPGRSIRLSPQQP
jgi:hypothetical protein